MDFLIQEDAAPLKTQWHQHLVSSLLHSAGSITTGRDAHGNYAEVEERPAPGAALIELIVRRFRDDRAETSPIVVTRRPAVGDSRPAVGLGPEGHFVVAWQAPETHWIFARRFDPDGAPRGAEFVVNTSAEPVPRLNPAVAVNAAGACVVLWEHGWTQLRARLFGPQGLAFGPEIDICTARR